MRKVLVETEGGLIRAYWIRDTDTDTRFGIPDNPPDLDRMDWDSVRLELSNLLTTEGFTTFKDIQARQQEFTGIILSVVRKNLVQLYKLQDLEAKDGKFNSAGKIVP